MEHEENQKSSSPPPISIFSRLDRLDRVVHYMEEKHSMSQREFSTAKDFDYNRVKPLATALDEIRVKGTLVERITMLESSVLQLVSIEMEEGTYSSSSSSTFAVPENAGLEIFPTKQGRAKFSSFLNEKDDYATPSESSLEEEHNMISNKPRSKRKGRSPALMMSSLRYHGKWLGCFHMPTR
ncbi:hypothetical protein C5167_013654 [Papaver somniferum]|uniref:Uncharacterized protein n=1 Tax=Papaver somniferum TaxID=3469 RepID=A0A4Y7J2X1_PAPSO|nr:hypothetical protein C5167_013654 [Papaver somniferum]